jgi:myo-inositol 2-dehydrogenase / D-chiro-inositol 1-dehydrogenase
MVVFCQFGAGRIGALHAANLASHPSTKLRYVVDVNAAAAQALAARHGARVTDAATALADPAVDAVLIASSTNTHADLIEAAARAGKTIFCEKPIDLSAKRAEACVKTVEKLKSKVLIGFNRRFDPSFQALHAAIEDGKVGDVEAVLIISRDPSLPSYDYLRTSGGLFNDMMIHDFDMARWLLGEEPVEVIAWASRLADPKLAKIGDWDTAAVTLRTAKGKLCQINNGRRAVFGYDQRIEVYGSKGTLRAANRSPTSLEVSTEAGVVRDKPYHFFLQRYTEAYRAELDHFLEVAAGKAKPLVGARDGYLALKLADAATKSAKTGKPVRV